VVLDAIAQPIIEARAAYDATSEKLKAEVDKKDQPSEDKAPAAAKNEVQTEVPTEAKVESGTES